MYAKITRNYMIETCIFRSARVIFRWSYAGFSSFGTRLTRAGIIYSSQANSFHCIDSVLLVCRQETAKVYLVIQC